MCRQISTFEAIFVENSLQTTDSCGEEYWLEAFEDQFKLELLKNNNTSYNQVEHIFTD